MKRNMFGEMKIQPGDDLRLLWTDEYEVDWGDLDFDVIDVCEDENFGWGCTLQDSEGNEAELHDFSSREKLVEFLNKYEVEAE